MAFAGDKGLGEVFCDERRSEAWPRAEMAMLNSAETSGGQRTKSASVKEQGKVLFCSDIADGAVGGMGRDAWRVWTHF
jgi:hypothetical protein